MKPNCPFFGAIFYFVGVFVFSPVASAQENWDAFRKCKDLNVPAVAKHVESLNEGANLITQSLCQKATTELMNQMVANRKKQPIQFIQAFEILQRETRLSIFKHRAR